MAIEEEIDFDIDLGVIDAAARAVEALTNATRNAAKAASSFSDAAAGKFAAVGQAAASFGAATRDALVGSKSQTDAMSAALKQLEGDYKMLNDAARNSADPETFMQLKAHAEKAAAAIKKVKGEMKAIAGESITGKIKNTLSKGLSMAWGGFKKAGSAALKVTGEGLKTVGKLAAGAAVAGLIAVAAALKKIGETVIARDNLRATLDQVTKGRGSEALKALDKLAKGLNMSIEDVTQQFVDLRKKGVSNIDASKLIKLRADLEAVGVSAEDAAKAVDETVAAIKSGKNADQAIKDTAKKFGAIGDGSNASAKKAFTLEGQIKAAMLAIEQAIGKVADKLGPTILKLVSAFTSGFDNLDPDAFDKYIDAIKENLEAVIPVAKVVGKGIATVFSAISASAQAMGGVISFVIAAVQVAAQYLSAAWQAAGPTVMAVFSAIGSAVQTVGSIISSAISAAVGVINGFRDAFSSAGGSLVDGFIAGIKAAVGKAVAAAKDLGKGAADALKSSLGIASPSKVAAGFGRNFGETFAATAEESTPELSDIVPTPRSGGNGPSGASSKKYEITINVNGGNASAQEIGAEVEIAVENAIRRAG